MATRFIAARKRLAEWFAFWPSEMKGQLTFRFENDFLVLGHDGGKLRFFMRRKLSDPSVSLSGIGKEFGRQYREYLAGTMATDDMFFFAQALVEKGTAADRHVRERVEHAERSGPVHIAPVYPVPAHSNHWRLAADLPIAVCPRQKTRHVRRILSD